VLPEPAALTKLPSLERPTCRNRSDDSFAVYSPFAGTVCKKSLDHCLPHQGSLSHWSAHNSASDTNCRRRQIAGGLQLISYTYIAKEQQIARLIRRKSPGCQSPQGCLNQAHSFRKESHLACWRSYPQSATERMLNVALTNSHGPAVTAQIGMASASQRVLPTHAPVRNGTSPHRSALPVFPRSVYERYSRFLR
jgi:hypothetical protein